MAFQPIKWRKSEVVFSLPEYNLPEGFKGGPYVLENYLTDCFVDVLDSGTE